MALRPGPTNSIADVRGIRVGHCTRDEEGWLTGTTVVLAPAGGAVGGVDVRGGGPGTRETDLLDPRNLVERVDAVVLTGGSAFGLAAVEGVVARLAAAGHGFPVGIPGVVVPIVPAAVLFDLGRGGDPYSHPGVADGTAAYDAAVGATQVPQGCVGAGTGAVAGGLKGGVGTASAVLESDQVQGGMVAALVAVNSAGSAVDPATGQLYAAPFTGPGELTPWVGMEAAGEGQGHPETATESGSENQTAAGLAPGKSDGGAAGAAGGAAEGGAASPSERGAPADGPADGTPEEITWPGRATTIGVIATDLTLTKAQCAKLAGVAHDGLARAIRPAHSMVDGDTFFALATGTRPAPDLAGYHELLSLAADCVTRSIALALLHARSVTTAGGSWSPYRPPGHR